MGMLGELLVEKKINEMFRHQSYYKGRVELIKNISRKRFLNRLGSMRRKSSVGLIYFAAESPVSKYTRNFNTLPLLAC